MWDRIDPLAEKYYGISPYVYCGGDPVNLIDVTGMAPSDSVGLVISDAIYNAEVGSEVEGYVLMEIFERGTIKMGKYVKMNEDQTQDIVVANAGTRNIYDAVEDVKQHFANTKDMKESQEKAKEWKSTMNDGDEITMVGHSKGGLEAEANALVTNTDAMLYDPAPMTKRMAKKLGKDNYTGAMKTFQVNNSILRLINGSRPNPVGETIRLIPAFIGYHPIKNHRAPNIKVNNSVQ